MAVSQSWLIICRGASLLRPNRHHATHITTPPCRRRTLVRRFKPMPLQRPPTVYPEHRRVAGAFSAKSNDREYWFQQTIRCILGSNRATQMPVTPKQFRQITLSFPDTEERAQILGHGQTNARTTSRINERRTKSFRPRSRRLGPQRQHHNPPEIRQEIDGPPSPRSRLAKHRPPGPRGSPPIARRMIHNFIERTSHFFQMLVCSSALPTPPNRHSGRAGRLSLPHSRPVYPDAFARRMGRPAQRGISLSSCELPERKIFEQPATTCPVRSATVNAVSSPRPLIVAKSKSFERNVRILPIGLTIYVVSDTCYTSACTLKKFRPPAATPTLRPISFIP
jgi:hypothetical protein